MNNGAEKPEGFFFFPLKVPGVNLIRLHFAQNYLDFEIPAAPLGRWGAWARERGYAGGQVGERASWRADGPCSCDVFRLGNEARACLQR